MLTVIIGKDPKKVSAALAKIVGNHAVETYDDVSLSNDVIDGFLHTDSLFGNSNVIIVKDFLASNAIDKLVDSIPNLVSSKRTFVFTAPSLLKVQKEWFKQAEIIETAPPFVKRELPIVFTITDAFARREKVKAWIAFSEAIELGIEPRQIHGTLFWKVKSLKNNTEMLRELVHIVHQSMASGASLRNEMELFILKSL